MMSKTELHDFKYSLGATVYAQCGAVGCWVLTARYPDWLTCKRCIALRDIPETDIDARRQIINSKAVEYPNQDPEFLK